MTTTMTDAVTRRSVRRAGPALGLLVAALVGCDGSGGAPGPDAASRAEGGGAAVAAPAAVVLRDGVQAAPGTRVIEPGAGATASGWYAALDLGDAAPREVAAFYASHLAGLGFTLDPATGPLTVVATRPTGPTTRVRVDVVPTSGEVPGFVRLVAQA